MHCERKSYLLHHSRIGSQQTHPCGVNQLLNLHRPPFLSSCKDRVCELWVGPSSDPKANLPFLHSLCYLHHHRDTNSFSKHASSLHSFLLFLWSHLCLLLMLYLHLLLLFPPSSKRIPKNPSQISCWCRPLTCTSASAIRIVNPHRHQPQQQTKHLRNSSPKSNPTRTTMQLQHIP